MSLIGSIAGVLGGVVSAETPGSMLHVQPFNTFYQFNSRGALKHWQVSLKYPPCWSVLWPVCKDWSRLIQPGLLVTGGALLIVIYSTADSEVIRVVGASRKYG